MHRRAVQRLPGVSANVRRTFARCRSGGNTRPPAPQRQKGSRGGAPSSAFNGKRDTRKFDEKAPVSAELRKVLSPEACGWLEGSLAGATTEKGKGKDISTEARPAGPAPPQSLEKATFESSASPESEGSMFGGDVQDLPGEGHGTRIASGTLVELRR